MSWIDRYVGKVATSPKGVASTRFLNTVHEIARMNGPRSDSVPAGYLDKLDLFCDTFSLAAESITASAKLLVILVEENENVFEEILARVPHVSYATLEGLYRCGKSGLDPMLMLKNAPVARQVLRLNEAEIKSAVKKGVPVVDASGVLPAVVYRPIEEVSQRQIGMAIGGDGRFVDREELVRRYSAQNEKEEPLRYDIEEDGTVCFHARVKMDPSALQEVARRAAEKALTFLKGLKTTAKA